MWSELSFPWRVCVEMAWEAYCADTVPIGAAMVNPAGCVVSSGRNRLNAPREASLEYLSGSLLAHAEINAILALDTQIVNPRECILYTTTEPCPMCAGAIVMANIRQVRFAARDPWAGATSMYTALPYLSGKHMRVEGPLEPRLEGVLFAIETDYFLNEEATRRGGLDPLTRLEPLLGSMRAAYPAGVRLGEQLYQTGELRQMRSEAFQAREIVDTLERMIDLFFVTN
jgi:tRNA(adenine34) deaminase